jgi:hypothetical protein
MQYMHERRIGELEDELKERDRRILDLRAERDAERALVAQMREHVEDANALIERWIEGFNMTLNDKGLYCWEEALMQERDALWEKHLALVRKWNKFVPRYNGRVAPRNFGRPLAASESQRADVLKRRKAGQSLRDIAEDTNLSLRTVRTIVDKTGGVDRATLARLQRIAPDKFAEARQRSSKRSRDALPRRINETLARGKDLLKKAKQGTAL